MDKVVLLIIIILISIPVYFNNINRLEKADLEELKERYEMNFLHSNNKQYNGAKILWVTESKKGYKITTPINLNGIPHVESGDVLYQINLNTGKPRFNLKKDELEIEQDTNVVHHLKDPIANSNIKIEKDNSNSLQIINKVQNKVLWEFDSYGARVDYIATQNVLFVRTSDSYRSFNRSIKVEYLYSFDIESGEQLLKYKVKNTSYDFFENVWNLENHLLFRIDMDNIMLVDKNTGKLLWSYPYKDTISSKQVYDGILYIVNEYHDLTAIDLLTGQKIWENKFFDTYAYDLIESQNSNSTFPATFVQDKMIISGHSGLLVVDKRTGETLWKFTIEDNANEIFINFAQPVVIVDDVLYAASTGGLLFAIKAEF